MKCDNCGWRIPPRASHCVKCEAKLESFGSRYSNVPMSEQEAKQQTESARGDFEPSDLISKEGNWRWDWTAERPIGDYLKRFGEAIHYLLYAKETTFSIVERKGNKAYDYSPDDQTRPQIAITAGRTLAVIPVNGVDVTFNIPHDDVIELSTPDQGINSEYVTLVLDCDDAEYKLPISKEIPDAKRNAAMEYLSRKVDGIEYSNSRASETEGEFPHSATETAPYDADSAENPALAALALSSEAFELDSIIEQSSTSSEVATEVADRLAEEWERELPDDRVQDASTVDDLVGDSDSLGARQVAKVECPNCGNRVYAYRDQKGRVLITSTGGLVLGGLGAGLGSIVGIATGGWGTVATVPFGAAGAVIGGGLGYILGDQMDEPHCPKCEEPIDLGI